MNEQLEINGDLADEYREIQEAEYREANEDAPEVEWTDEDIDAYFLDWCERNGEVPDLIPDGETPDGTPRWRFA